MTYVCCNMVGTALFLSVSFAVLLCLFGKPTPVTTQSGIFQNEVSERNEKVRYKENEIMNDILLNSVSAEVLANRSSSILLCSFISKNIYAYSAMYQQYNNQHFSRENAVVRYFTEDTGHNYVPDDMRWNKIAIIVELLHRYLNLPSTFEYIAFFDADVLFLRPPTDFLQEIIEGNQYSTVILSKDALDFANSGFIITRINSLALQFFTRWWELRSTENTFCDQHVLNILSLQLQNENLLKHVAVVPFGIINSKWPPLENFDPVSDNVLHLMGEYDFVREAIGVYMNSLPQEEGFNSTLKDTLLTVKLNVLHQAFFDALNQSDMGLALNIVSHVAEMQIRHQEQAHPSSKWGQSLQINGTRYLDEFEDILRGKLTCVNISLTSDQDEHHTSNCSSNDSDSIDAIFLRTLILKVKLFPFTRMVTSDRSPKSIFDHPLKSSSFSIFIRTIMLHIEDMKVKDDEARLPMSGIHYFQHRVLLFESATIRLRSLLVADVWQQSMIRNVHDQQRLWKWSWKYCTHSLNTSAMLLNEMSIEQLPQSTKSEAQLQHLRLLFSRVQLQLLKPTLFGYEERNSAWENAHEACDDSMVYIENLQHHYTGEIRLLVTQVKDLLNACISIYSKRRNLQSRVQELSQFVRNMRYFGE